MKQGQPPKGNNLGEEVHLISNVIRGRGGGQGEGVL